MEFRYQPVEDRPSTFFSSTTTNSYFTEQALRVGLISDNRSNEVVRDAVGVREAVNRELEKERIRAELIAAEVGRRRVLEVEVRMELQMERELSALRRREGVSSILSDPRIPLMHHPNGGRVEERIPLTSFSEVDMRYPEGSRLEERLSFPSRLEIGKMHPEGSRAEGSRVADRLYFPGRPQIVEGLQFQSHPETTEISKGKAVFLAKPLKTSLAGMRRKQIALAATGAGELSMAGSKKKSQKEWSCAMCQVSTTSEQDLNDHLQGRKHRAMEAELKAKNVTGKNTGISTSLPKKMVKPTKLFTSSRKIKQGKQKGARKQHIKQNEKMLTQRKHKIEDSKKQNGDEPLLKKQKTEDSKMKNAEAPVPKKRKRKASKKKFTLWCEMCKVGANNESVMASHRTGKKHMTQLMQLEQNVGAASATTTATRPEATERKTNVELATKETDKTKERVNGEEEVGGVEAHDVEPVENLTEVEATGRPLGVGTSRDTS